MHKQSGFTIVELIIVIAIIAVAAAVAVPSYMSWLPDIRLRSAVRDLKSDLGLAKQRAIRENGQVAVVFDTGNNSYKMFVDDGASPNDWIHDSDEDLLKTVTMPVGVTMDSASFAGGQPRVRFDGRGLPNGFGGNVRMKNTRNNYRGISMSPLGLITVQTSSDGGGTWQDAE